MFQLGVKLCSSEAHILYLKYQLIFSVKLQKAVSFGHENEAIICGEIMEKFLKTNGMHPDMFCVNEVLLQGLCCRCLSVCSFHKGHCSPQHWDHTHSDLVVLEDPSLPSPRLNTGLQVTEVNTHVL